MVRFRCFVSSAEAFFACLLQLVIGFGESPRNSQNRQPPHNNREQRIRKAWIYPAAKHLRENITRQSGGAVINSLRCLSAFPLTHRLVALDGVCSLISGSVLGSGSILRVFFANHAHAWLIESFLGFAGSSIAFYPTPHLKTFWFPSVNRVLRVLFLDCFDIPGSHISIQIFRFGVAPTASSS